MKKISIASLAFLFSLIACQANAATLEELVITAQKREQSLQDVGISVSAVSGDLVEKLNLTNVLSLATVVPSLTAVDGSAGAPSYRIRGVGIAEFSGAFDGPVGVHVDEVFLFKPALTTLGYFDVSRVEVLNGPQGTVFGRNTTAGAVNYYSNLPTDEGEGYIDVSYGRFDRLELNAAVSGPLIDNLKGRLAVQVKDWGAAGPYFNLFDSRELGDLDTKNIRGILEWNNDTTLVRGTLEIGSLEGELPPYDNLFQTSPGVQEPANEDIRNPISRFTVNQNYYQTTDTESVGAHLRVEHETDLGTLTSITAYKDFERLNREDTDNTPTETVDIDWNSRLDYLSQEIRFSGERGSWNYMFGAFYEDNSADILDQLRLGFFGTRDYTVDQKTWALFTNNEFALSENLSLIAGARYTSDEQVISGFFYTAPSGAATGDFDRVAVADRDTNDPVEAPDISDSDLNFKLGLNYHLSEDVLLFASVSTGFRNGGYDPNFFAGTSAEGIPAVDAFEPEDTTAFEFGVKSSWLENSLVVNAALFSTEIENYQDTVGLPTSITPRRRNTGTLETTGLELDVQWAPSEAWRLTFGYASNDAQITSSDLIISGRSFEGTAPVNAPENKLSTTINYTKPIGNGLLFDALLSAQWQDERFLEPDNGPDHLVESHSTADATISLLSSDETWRLSVWGKNITNEDYLLYINDIPAIPTFLTVRADPATYGVSFRYNF